MLTPTLFLGKDYTMNGWPNAHFDKNMDEPFCYDYHKFGVSIGRHMSARNVQQIVFGSSAGMD